MLSVQAISQFVVTIGFPATVTLILLVQLVPAISRASQTLERVEAKLDVFYKLHSNEISNAPEGRVGPVR